MFNVWVNIGLHTSGFVVVIPVVCASNFSCVVVCAQASGFVLCLFVFVLIVRLGLSA